MTLTELASFVAVILAAYATYRNTTRKAEFDRLSERVVDLEKRLADAEQRATDNEHKAIEYREDIIQIGQRMQQERDENTRRLMLVAQDAADKINRVVIVLEKVIKDFECATGTTPDVDMEALKRLVRIDHVTGPLGPIDVEAVRRHAGER